MTTRRTSAGKKTAGGKKRTVRKTAARRPRATARRKVSRRRPRRTGWAARLRRFVKRMRRKLPLPDFWVRTGTVLFGLAFWGIVCAAGLLWLSARGLPDTATLWNTAHPPGITIYDRDGVRIASRGDGHGLTVALGEVPPYLPEAVVAIEDRRFYHHTGVDYVGIARAFAANLRQRRIAQGGSTITQQLARNLFLTPERTLTRKMQELILAYRLEHRFTKDQILSLYLNRVYLGSGAYGVDAAAQRYFSRPASDVTLYQAAMLAGLLKAPTTYSPLNHPEKARARTLVVLNAMREEGYISDRDLARAARAGTAVAKSQDTDNVGYFADWIMSGLSGRLNEYRAGDSAALPRDLRVYTSLDSRLQRIAAETLESGIDRDGPAYRFTQAAMVVLDRRGRVRAMVGGRAYRRSQFNRAVQARRQPGSAFKPFVYATALQMGYSPDDRIEDAPVNIGGWTPANYSGEYYGRVTLRQALAQSLNAATVRLAHAVGRNNIARTAHRLGLTSKLAPNLSMVLGTSEVSLAELSAAYVPFMNGGRPTGFHGIERVVTADGHVLFEAQRAVSPPVLRAEEVAQMNDMLSAVMEWGTGRHAALTDRPSAGKSGTTQSNRDAWFIGYTSDLLAGVWVGNDDNSPMAHASTGGGVAGILWAEFMSRATAGTPPVPLPGGKSPRLADRHDTSTREGRGSVKSFLANLFKRDQSEPGLD